MEGQHLDAVDDVLPTRDNLADLAYVLRIIGQARNEDESNPDASRATARGFNTALGGVVVNPTLDLVWDAEGAGAILPEEPDMMRESEGCLSVPGYGYPLRRALGAVLRGYDVSGAPIEVTARGWLARIFQHEYDHLRGTLYVDRLAQPYADEAGQVIRERGWGRSGYTWTPGE